MIINCICGKKQFKLADEVMPSEGSKVRCGSCSEVWFYHPNQGESKPTKEIIENEIQNSQLDTPSEQVTENKIETSSPDEQSVEITAEAPPAADDPEELLSTIDNDEILDNAEKENKDSVPSFKIFSDEENDLPSKAEMDKNLDTFKIERDQNLNFFQKLFKKDRIGDAKKFLEKKDKENLTDDEKKSNIARRTRLLFYLLILLTIVFSVVIVPIRQDIVLAFPFLESYLDFLVPVYDYIKGPLGLSN